MERKKFKIVYCSGIQDSIVAIKEKLDRVKTLSAIEQLKELGSDIIKTTKADSYKLPKGGRVYQLEPTKTHRLHCYMSEDTFYIYHFFEKKRPTTPKKEIDASESKLKQLKIKIKNEQVKRKSTEEKAIESKSTKDKSKKKSRRKS